MTSNQYQGEPQDTRSVPVGFLQHQISARVPDLCRWKPPHPISVPDRAPGHQISGRGNLATTDQCQGNPNTPGQCQVEPSYTISVSGGTPRHQISASVISSKPDQCEEEAQDPRSVQEDRTPRHQISSRGNLATLLYQFQGNPKTPGQCQVEPFYTISVSGVPQDPR